MFVQNTREFELIETENFGIKNHSPSRESKQVLAGEEKGYFEFGGSTIILLFEKDRMVLKEELYGRIDGNGEISVHMGETIGYKYLG